jgi:hypothetical protein
MWTTCVARGFYPVAYGGWWSLLGLAVPPGEMELGMMLLQIPDVWSLCDL